ncbi:carbohydrate ABC transporter permease [Paenibacillus sp. GCM10023248]|uniref:carbohydrate ABC transporter permease n=1 Tax=Bacillales TaxID=1385 RepID=UPI00237880D4|nr:MULTISPECIES: carbohydrate ABC transporter permease [Bacillales]MDD9269574.1 carbohydrate ABC transporter permease [Paenibacillus sp. MAHUQ-63]MDR6880795.1 putative aldouronate transport system permease protein [Bacillus sp. 3255]
MVIRKIEFGSFCFNAIIYLMIIIMLFTFLYPLYYVVIVSLSDGLSVMRGDIRWLPIGINFEAYRAVLDNPLVLRAYGNTILYTVVGTFINVMMTALCAYPLSRNRFYGRNVFTVFIIITMLFHGGLIPNYLVVYRLHMLNSIWAIVIPAAINVWNMIIMRTFFQNIPNEIYESAHMDGAHDMKIFLRIVLPLSMPVIATMCMFYAVAHWNSFFPATLYLSDSKLYPIQVIVRNYVIDGLVSSGSNAESDSKTIVTSMKYAFIFITLLPILAVYPFIQKYFVKGVMVGSLKG